VAKLKLLTNNPWAQLILAEDPPAFEVLHLVKYFENFIYFIWDAMARLLKTSGLASGNTNCFCAVGGCAITSGEGDSDSDMCGCGGAGEGETAA